jgi:hypothetical protein
MSWDVLFMDLPPGAESVSDMPGDFAPAPLGARKDIIARIQARIPEVDFRDPAWGLLEGPEFSIELNLGAKEVADSLMLHVRGGSSALGAVRTIAEALDRRAFDCQTGELLDLDSPEAEASFAEWRRFRDRVVSHTPNDDEGKS